MFYQTEDKAQTWRALATFEDGSECLLYLGRSVPQVRAGYAGAYHEVLTDEERGRVRGIALQCWQGAPDQGRWAFKSALPIPRLAPVAVPTGSAEPGPRLLPFRVPAA